MSRENEYLILSGRAHPEFTEKMGEILAKPEFTDVEDDLQARIGEITRKDFRSNEQFVRIEESVRGKHVFVVQPHGGHLSPNDALIEQCLIIQAAKLSSAKEVTAVSPYMGYLRQDRKSNRGEGISAKFVVDALVGAAGADRIVTVDMHSSQIQGFTNVPFDHLTASLALETYTWHNFGEKITDDRFVVASPDVGRLTVARQFQVDLGLDVDDVGCVFKGRKKEITNGNGTVESNVKTYGVLGNVAGKTTLLVDDMIDTFGTMKKAAEALEEEGAEEIYAMGTHPVLSHPALDNLNNSPIKELIVTDTLPLPEGEDISKIRTVTATYLIGKAIHYIANDKSVSELFKGRNYS